MDLIKTMCKIFVDVFPRFSGFLKRDDLSALGKSIFDPFFLTEVMKRRGIIIDRLLGHVDDLVLVYIDD